MGKVQKKCMQRNLQHIYVSVTFTIAIYNFYYFLKKELTGSKKCGKILDVRKSGMDLHKENKKDNKQTTQTRCKKSKQ